MIIRRRELIGEIKLPEYKSFSTCTMAEIKKICDAKLASTYWSSELGDVNTNATYGSYSGVRLIHILTEEQRGSDYYGTNGHIVVDFVNVITTSVWNNDNTTQTSYSASTIFSTLNTIYSSGINAEFKAVLSPFAPATSVQSSSSQEEAETSIEHPLGYLHIPNCTELGSYNRYRPSENAESFCFDYFNISSGSTKWKRRKKSGAETWWWPRSPSVCSGGTKFMSYIVWDDGDMDGTSQFVSIARGVSPIACI